MRVTNSYLWMTFIGTSGGSDYGTYFYDNGWYVKWIIEQGEYVNTAVEYLPYPSDEDAVHVEWLSSARQKQTVSNPFPLFYNRLTI